MAPRIDLHARTIEVGITTLLADDFGAATASPMRAAVGADIHQRVQARHLAEPGSRIEVPVQVCCEVDDFVATLRGRIDVLRCRPDGVRVEEIKSTVGPAPRGGPKLERASLQARIYAWALADAGERRPIEVCLRFVSVVDATESEIDLPWTVDGVRAQAQSRLRTLLLRAWREHEAAARRRAWAPGLGLPFDEPRPHQAALMSALQEALALGRPVLAAAPTGIGKTVSALVPALKFAIEHDVPLHWHTAKTTQAALVRDTLRRCVEASGPPPPLLAVTRRAKTRACIPGHLRCHPDACTYLDGIDVRLAADVTVTRWLDEGGIVEPEQVDALGRRARLCPWLVERRLAAHAQVVVGDYNYAFDPAIQVEGLAGVVRIVDEAHNLPPRALERDSPFVSSRVLEAARHVVVGDDVDPHLRTHVLALLDAVDAFIGARWAEIEAQEAAGLDGCAVIELDATAWTTLGAEAARLSVRWSAVRHRVGVSDPDDPLLRLLWTITDMDRVPARAEVVAFVAGPAHARGPGVGLVAVDSSERLAKVHAQARGTIAISATLAPLDAAVDELGLRGLHPITLDVPSPFSVEQLCVRIVDDVDTTLEARADHYEAIARHIDTVRAAHVGNYIAFFPSFAFAGSVAARLRDRRRMWMQLPGTPLASRRATLQRLQQERGCLLVAVTGGVFAEGIDLPGEALSGAVIVGPGPSPVAFDRELRRHRYDDNAGDGFARAYAGPAMRRVVQAAGRVVRTLTDRGVLVLIGRRFTRPPYASLLPDAWTRGNPASMITRDLPEDLRHFWERGTRT